MIKTGVCLRGIRGVKSSVISLRGLMALLPVRATSNNTMPAWTLTSGCGCANLRTSSFILGYIDLAVTIIWSLITLMFIIAGALLPSPFSGTKPLTEERWQMVLVMIVLTTITLVYVLLMLAFTVTLLVGLHKARRKLVKLYLVAALVFFLLDFVVFFVGFVLGYSTETVIIRILILILEAYSFLVIRSYYYEMKDDTYTTA